MPTSAIVPNTQIRTNTIGTTATSASAGWRCVTQKKMARMPSAAAMVILIDSVCRSVIESVTAEETMVSEVAVIAWSSLSQSASSSCCTCLAPETSPDSMGN